MIESKRGRTVWARDVARAMAFHFSTLDCDFSWANAHEDNLSKTPTRAWPDSPWLTFQVDEGPASGLHVHVLNRADVLSPEPLVTLKFKAPLDEARQHITLVSNFLKSIDPKRLPSA